MTRSLIAGLLLSGLGFAGDALGSAAGHPPAPPASVISGATRRCGVAGEQPRCTPSGKLALWQAPRVMTHADWVWGEGGEQKAPLPPFQFVRENRGGTNPKID